MDIVKRFLDYVSFDTTSEERTENFPTTEKQFELAKFLEKELKELGLSNVELDENCYVYGTLPANTDEKLDTIGLMAHIDVSPAVPGNNIKPNMVNYQGGDIELSTGIVMKEKDFPYLKNYVGQTLITTDGTTLLGADDKGGIAEIVTAVEYLLNHPEVKHGKIMVVFNPDEEVGRGTEKINLEKFKVDYCYTVDGGALGELEYECFNAAAARMFFNGLSVHPGSAKNIMKNAILYANEFISMLPPAETPAHTEKYEGFYHVEGIEGNETLVILDMIIRDHSRKLFEGRKEFVKKLVDFLNDKYGENTVELELSDTYYNMGDVLVDHMDIVERAKKAFIECGVTPEIKPIRGGTDGSALTFMGVPCPNLSTGGENYHGVMEFVSVDAMNKMVEVIVKLVSAE